jgi:outer membrane receptor protein involved in Fe transport
MSYRSTLQPKIQAKAESKARSKVDSNTHAKTDSRSSVCKIACLFFVICHVQADEPKYDKQHFEVFKLSLPELLQVEVTANKQKQNLQKVSSSVSVLNNQTINNAEVKGLTDLENIVPGLLVGFSGSEIRPSMRGARTNEVGVAGTGLAEHELGIFNDGIYTPTTTAGFIPYVDIERIEVLRGPQGTLYGRNTFAGSLNIISKQPDFVGDVRGELKLTSGNYDKKAFQAIINLPHSETLASRFVFDSVNQAGLIVNHHQAGTSDDLRENKSWYFRSITQYTPSSDFSSTLRLEYFNKNQNADGIWGYQQTYGYQISETTPGSGIFNPDATVTAGHIGRPSDSTYPDEGPYDVFRNANAKDKQENTSVTLSLLWKADFADIQWTNNIQNLKGKQFFDIDYSDGGTDVVGGFGRQDDGRTFSSELQLSSKNQQMSWIAGLYYYKQAADWEWLWRADTNSDGIDDAIVVPSWGNPSYDPHEVSSLALFGQINYQLSNATRLVAGLRLNEDRKSFTGNEIPNWDDSALLWKAGIEYDKTDKIMLFASVATGYRTGGANDSRVVARGAPALYGNEQVISYEMGMKSQLFDNRARFNLSAYFVEYADVKAQLFAVACNDTTSNQSVLSCVSQQTASTFEYYQNGGDVHASGLDLELEWLASKQLNITSYLAYLDAQFANHYLVGSDSTKPLLGLGNFEGRQDINDSQSRFDFSGWQPAFSPRYAMGLTFLHTQPLINDNWLSSYLQLAYTDDYYAFDVNIPETKVDAHLMMNAKLAWQLDANMIIEGSIKNLTNEAVKTRAVVHSEIINQLPVNQVQVNWNNPRTWEINLRYTFK